MERPESESPESAVDDDPEYEDELELNDPEHDDDEPDSDPEEDQGDAEAVNKEAEES